MGASRRLGIFGGSFNPPHNGHVGACHYCFAQDLVDQILVIPCFLHPYRKPLAPFPDRVAMCHAAFDAIRGVIVSEIERELGGLSHTIRMIRRLKVLHPEEALLLFVGEDLQAEIALWKDVDAIREEAQFLTLPRGDRSPIPDVSATAVREAVAKNAPLDPLVPPAVAEYIAIHRLYRV